MTVRTKICGIRSEHDLRLAVEAGADAVGFLCGLTHFSEDGLGIDDAKHIADQVPPFVNKVLVTHREEAVAILDLAERVGVDTIQVHGLVTPQTMKQVRDGAGRRTIVKAVHVTGEHSVEEAKAAAAHCDAVLLDSRTTDRLGGTGCVHDWTISARIVAELSRLDCPVVLAGGLNARNVAAAIERVRPFAVDVNSGVEDPDGAKSLAECRAFVRAARYPADRSSLP
ncbi:phosphoribosylanthranilate isomerase [Nocardia asteroides]|uniref:phosphoribosylanthranilate isomerase n=1 Tax=Nocardia asteroides TaxID=1824 RepID=UPI0036652FE3